MKRPKTEEEKLADARAEGYSAGAEAHFHHVDFAMVAYETARREREIAVRRAEAGEVKLAKVARLVHGYEELTAERRLSLLAQVVPPAREPLGLVASGGQTKAETVEPAPSRAPQLDSRQASQLETPSYRAEGPAASEDVVTRARKMVALGYGEPWRSVVIELLAELTATTAVADHATEELRQMKKELAK